MGASAPNSHVWRKVMTNLDQLRNDLADLIVELDSTLADIDNVCDPADILGIHEQLEGQSGTIQTMVNQLAAYI
jgi:hypothetical protein